jgi:hypothetical protein
MESLGIDVHSKYSEVCGLSDDGTVTVRRRVPTTETSLRRFFGSRERSKVTLESGPVTPWVYRLLCELGHDVVVVNPRRVRLIAESTLETDGIDAEVLARLSRLDLDLLRPVYPADARSAGATHPAASAREPGEDADIADQYSPWHRPGAGVSSALMSHEELCRALRFAHAQADARSGSRAPGDDNRRAHRSHQRPRA